MGVWPLGDLLMMKKQAILIQCHNKPEQINVLIDTFPEEQFDFYVHVDKKSDIQKDIFKKAMFILRRVVLMSAGEGTHRSKQPWY